ncbi:MAG: four-carbon acid sugar kinase family protein [Tibeticola sp.]
MNPHPLLLGCIADDFTGATDLANTLVRGGLRVVQMLGLPEPGDMPPEADAVVVALKTRSIAPQEAVAQSLQALQWLKSAGARQIFFKICSTFDSTPLGNIGPVIDALMDALGCDFSVATPAFPENGRTVFQGHLFVGPMLLNESGMQHHPLTPMTDANLVRVLQAQTRRRVGLIDQRSVAAGAEAIRARMAALRTEGCAVAIADAVSDEDLRQLARALADAPLLTGGSGLALGLPANFGFEPTPAAERLPRPLGARAVVSGSCSAASNRQVQDFIARGHAALAIAPLRAAAGEDVVAEALAWAAPRLGAAPVLVHATDRPEAVAAVQQRLGREAAGALVEGVLARIAQGLVALGVRQLVVAGGETSGAVLQALGVRQLQIGAQIDPGVPWCCSVWPPSVGRDAGESLHLALKSGNFGSDDCFTKAFAVLD